MITAANLSAKEKGVMATLYFNPEQTREILRDVSPTGLILMQHYVAIAKQPNPNMEDSTLASLLGMSKPTIEKTRLALTKSGWFKRIKKTDKQGVQIIYLVGKQAVSSAKFTAKVSG